METKKTSNPNALPDPMRGTEQSFSNQTPWDLEEGMTLRKYYAGLAMQGLLANANGAMTEGGSRTFSPDGISILALKHADALLERLSIETQS